MGFDEEHALKTLKQNKYNVAKAASILIIEECKSYGK